MSVKQERYASRRSNAPRRPVSPGRKLAEHRELRKARRASVYRRRRLMAVSLALLGVVALVFAVFSQASVATEGAVPIDPANAGPDTVLAEASGVQISTPIRPASLTGLGYHPEGESLLEMEPRGKNLSGNPLFGLLSIGSTPENIQYYLMDPANRAGPRTGALDVGAEAGTPVYAPVTGTITAIRPDPMIDNANVVEIKPADEPGIRITVSLVKDISRGTSVETPVTAGMTELGTVADSADFLKPQLAAYTTDAGNHVTISATKVN